MSKKRRKISGQVKLEAGMEVLRGEKSVAHICCERDLPKSLPCRFPFPSLRRRVSILPDGDDQDTSR
jgi:hypothetical protein